MKVKPAVIVFVLGLAPVTALLAIPGLRIGRTGSQVFLTWPKSATNLTLEVATNLSSPMVWRPASGPVTSVGDQNVVTDDITAPSRIYRLAIGDPRPGSSPEEDSPFDITRWVRRPAVSGLPVSPQPMSRHIATKEEATALAVDAANRATWGDFNGARFTGRGASATFDGRRWSWRRRVGYGKRDLEVEVTLASNGTVEDVRTRVLIYDVVREF